MSPIRIRRSVATAACIALSGLGLSTVTAQPASAGTVGQAIVTKANS